MANDQQTESLVSTLVSSSPLFAGLALLMLGNGLQHQKEQKESRKGSDTIKALLEQKGVRHQWHYFKRLAIADGRLIGAD